MAVIGEIFRTVVYHDVAGASEVQMVFTHELNASKTDTVVLSALVDWFTNTWGPDWQDRACEDAELTYIAVDVLNGDGTVARNIGTGFINLTGSITGDIGAVGVSAFIQAYTQFPKQRGRKYIPGFSKSDLTDGFWNAGTIADLAILAADLLLDINLSGGGQLVPGVLSRVFQAFEPYINAVYLTDEPAYQRRRKQSVGA